MRITIIIDPKGDIIGITGIMLMKHGYDIKVLNTINFKKSQHYNPLAYIHSEKDILKLVNALIANTKGTARAAIRSGRKQRHCCNVNRKLRLKPNDEYDVIDMG